MSGIDFAISLLKLVPTNAKVKSNVTPRPKDIIVIGVILFDCVIFLIDTFKGVLELNLNFFRENMINFESKKKIIKQIKNSKLAAEINDLFLQ